MNRKKNQTKPKQSQFGHKQNRIIKREEQENYSGNCYSLPHLTNDIKKVERRLADSYHNRLMDINVGAGGRQLKASKQAGRQFTSE